MVHGFPQSIENMGGKVRTQLQNPQMLVAPMVQTCSFAVPWCGFTTDAYLIPTGALWWSYDSMLSEVELCESSHRPSLTVSGYIKPLFW